MVLPPASTIAVFAAASLALLLVPGPAVLYIVAQSAGQGRRVGLASVAGIHLGTMVHVVAAAVGLSAVIVASATAFAVVKYVGAAYLVYIGIRRLLDRTPEHVDHRREPVLRAFSRGIVVNVLNPKTALFFLAFLPQFVDPGRGGVWFQVVVFGFVFVGLGLVSDSLYALAAGFLGGVLRRRPSILRYGSGSVYVGLGAVTALARRT